MKFTCPNCGARNSQFQDCGCEAVEDQDAADDPALDAAEHRWEVNQER